MGSFKQLSVNNYNFAGQELQIGVCFKLGQQTVGEVK